MYAVQNNLYLKLLIYYKHIYKINLLSQYIQS